MYFPFQLPIFGRGSNFRVIGLKQHGKAKLRGRNLLSVLRFSVIAAVQLNGHDFGDTGVYYRGEYTPYNSLNGRLPGPRWLSILNSGSKDQLYKKEELDPNKGSNQL